MRRRGLDARVKSRWRLPTAKALFAQILEGDLDALVVHLLIVGAKLIAAAGGAVEKLTDHPDGRMRLAVEAGGAANVDRAIEIEIDHVVVELAHQQARHRLMAY